MLLDATRLITDLHSVLTSQIALPRFYKARALGFRNELEFERAVKDRESLDAGQFLFSKKGVTGQKNKIAYVTVSTDGPEKYGGFYDIIGRMPEVERMFFIQTEDMDRWTETQIPIKDGIKRVMTTVSKPSFLPFEYDGGAWRGISLDLIKDLFDFSKIRACQRKDSEFFRYLNEYEMGEIAKIYCNRFFLDVTLIGRKKGMIDFDHILKIDGSYAVVETKEKTPMTDPMSFGWDSRRFSWYMYLRHATGLDCAYVIREVADITDRDFVGWKAISLDDFCSHASWLAERQGGGGGGTISAPYEAFGDLGTIFK